MDHTLVVIKRLCQAGRVVFTAKAESEMFRDGLRREEVILISSKHSVLP